MSTLSPLPARRYSRRVALAAAVPLLLAACAPNAAPTPALATATASGSAAAGRFTLATLIAATPEPVTPTTVAPTVPRPVSTAAINAVTATPRPLGTAAIVTAPVPVRGTNAPAPSAGPAGTLATYTEPGGGIRLQYPANWRATLPATANDRDLTLESPSNLLFSLAILEAPAGSPVPSVDEVAQEIRDSQMNNKVFAYTTEMLKDATVAGERGKSFDYTFVEQANRTATPRRGTYWVIPRDSRVYVFQASNIEAARPDVDAILNSVMFMTPQPVASPAATRAALPATRTGGVSSPAASPARATGSASAVTR